MRMGSGYRRWLMMRNLTTCSEKVAIQCP